MAGKRIAVFSLFALVALALALFATSGTQAQTYKPGFGYTVTDNTGGAASDTTNTIIILAPDYNYEDSSLYTFTPIDGWSATGDVIPIADEVGTLSATVAVGLLGGPCTTPLPPVFTLENATVDTSFELSPAETYWILKHATSAPAYPVPYRDKCENDIDDDADTKVNDGCPAIGPPETGAECDNDIDDDGDSFGASNNGVNDGCPAVGPAELLTDPLIPDYLEAYPSFINDLLDPDGPAGPKPPLQPRARYAGYTTVADMNILIQFLVLNPGQISELPGIKAAMGPELGHPSLIVLDNPLTEEQAPGAISDFCTPLVTTTTLLATTVANQYTHTGGGIVARTNPPTDSGVLGTGTHMSRNYSQSERDADGDGIENDMDPCRYSFDAVWDPRGLGGIIPGDADGDHLPDSCDPNPGITNYDEDGDGYDNGQDNCPLTPNGCNTPACSPAFPKNWELSWDNIADDDGSESNTDLGPGPDGIGNACDDSDGDGSEDGFGPGTCTDGIDNSGDGAKDELDYDCTGYEDPGNPTANSCLDGVDNDADDGCDSGGCWFDKDVADCTGPGDSEDGAGAGTCDDGIDNGHDGYCDYDGCTVGPDSTCQATNIVFDQYDPDPYGTNPGTGQFYHAMPSAAVTINAAVDNDGDGYSDALEGTLGSDPGNSAKTPESLVIDMTINATGGQPSANVPQSCSDGIDNDGDGKIDAADNDALGCDTTTYTGDADYDGVANDGTDNCPAVRNPEQTNTDAALAAGGASFGGVPLTGDAEGDACDTDDDNDGYTDAREWYLGTDPLDNCGNVAGKHAAWPLDMNMDTLVTVSGDVLKYRGNIQVLVDSNPPASWSLRQLDLNGDGLITVSGDVLKYRGNIQKPCT